MRKLLTIVLMLVAFMAIMVVTATAEEATKEAAKHDYVGVKKCKTCHKGQFAAWSETKHATAFASLSAEEAAKPECAKCHSTGALADGTAINNVECEACHGPGKDYKSAKIMSKKKWAADPETHKKLAADAGLIMPDEKVCITCHTKEGNANFKEFDFAKAKELVHPVKEEVKKEVKKEAGK